MPDIPPNITGLIHAGLLISDLTASRIFYESILGFQRLSRPDLPYPGEWYVLNADQQLHLMQLPNPDQDSIRPPHGGQDRHIAFGVAELHPLKARLDAAHVPYTVSRSGRAALFCRDPDGNTLEFIEIKSF